MVTAKGFKYCVKQKKSFPFCVIILNANEANEINNF